MSTGRKLALVRRLGRLDAYVPPMGMAYGERLSRHWRCRAVRMKIERMLTEERA